MDRIYRDGKEKKFTWIKGRDNPIWDFGSGIWDFKPQPYIGTLLFSEIRDPKSENRTILSILFEFPFKVKKEIEK
jgi:hypothetical protein